MLDLGDLKAQVAELETELAEQVLLQEATQRIGNIEAKYKPGRTFYDWETTVRSDPELVADPDQLEELVATYTETRIPEPITKTDWRGIAHRRNLDGIVSKPPVPSVQFSLLGD